MATGEGQQAQQLATMAGGGDPMMMAATMGGNALLNAFISMYGAELGREMYNEQVGLSASAQYVGKDGLRMMPQKSKMHDPAFAFLSGATSGAIGGAELYKDYAGLMGGAPPATTAAELGGIYARPDQLDPATTGEYLGYEAGYEHPVSDTLGAARVGPPADAAALASERLEFTPEYQRLFEREHDRYYTPGQGVGPQISLIPPTTVPTFYAQQQHPYPYASWGNIR